MLNKLNASKIKRYASMEMYTPSVEIPKKENKMYPQRAFASVDASIKRLEKLQNGEIEKVELSEQERTEILSFENKLGIELEEIFKIKVNSAGLHPEYFLSSEGKDFFKTCAGFDIEGDDVDSIVENIYKNRLQITNIAGTQLKKIEGQSKKYSEDILIEKISGSISDGGDISVDGVEVVQAVNVLLNPENALEKIQKLRDFKRTLKGVATSGEAGKEYSENHQKALAAIFDQYRKRVNEIIVDQFGYVVEIKSLADKIGEENLSQDEKKLLEQFSGINEFVSVYSRFDKLIFGAEDEIDERGNYRQIGKEIEKYAEEMESKYIENELLKKQKAAEKGLSFEKITNKNISKDVFVKYAEDFLQAYDQKSSMSAEEFDPKRKGAAPDGKWQFVTNDGYGSMSVSKNQNIIKAPTRERSAHELISIMLGHEFTHFIQALNQSKIKLKLYDEIGGDRRLVLAEGAAMSMQKQISEEIFGFSELPKPNYVKAMSKKINGGNYLDCVKAYYDCAMKIYLETSNEKDPNMLREKGKEMVGVSVRSCKRLFRAGENLKSTDAILSKSKDTVYLEQLMVMDRLKKAGLEKFALVRGLNMDSLFVLLQNGFIKEKDIETLDLDFVRKIWEELKKDYLL